MYRARGARVAAELRERRVVEGEALGQQVLDDDRRELPRARVQRPHGPDAREAAGELRRVLPLPGLELGLRFRVARLRGIAEVLEDADQLLQGIDGRRHRVATTAPARRRARSCCALGADDDVTLQLCAARPANEMMSLGEANIMDAAWNATSWAASTMASIRADDPGPWCEVDRGAGSFFRERSNASSAASSDRSVFSREFRLKM